MMEYLAYIGKEYIQMSAHVCKEIPSKCVTTSHKNV